MAESNEDTPQPMKLSYARSAPKARWVLLGEHENLEAQVAQAKLQSKGIPCHLSDQNTALIYSAMIGSDVHLQVLDRDLERARAVLDEIRNARPKNPRDEAHRDDDWRCSKCRSKRVSRVPLSPPVLVLSLLLLGLPLLFIKRHKRCKHCRHTWSA